MSRLAPIRSLSLAICFSLLSVFCIDLPAYAEGEPAADFLSRLRAAKYFDIAIAYLDRLEQYPGVDRDLLSAVSLEKAQTLIDAAVASRSSKDREEFFASAEGSLSEFLANKNHPRAAEARMRLGNLQTFRGAQYLMGEPDADKKKQARESYIAASKTFEAIVADLRQKLTDMRTQKVDPKKEPEKASRRDEYRYQFLEAQVSAGETKILAAKTFDAPEKEAKPILDEAVKRFTEMNDKYSDYVQGAKSILFLGQAHELLGDKEKAIRFYKDMVDQIEADPLRDSKYAAAAGLIRMYMKESKPKYKEGIEAAKSLEKGIRPNERSLPNVQDFRLNLAKAYLAKSVDKENNKATDMKRAKSSGRGLLLEASKVPGPHLAEVKEILSGLGIDQETAELPTADPPKSLEDAMESAREVLQASQNLESGLAALEGQKDKPQIKKQIDDMQGQLRDTKSIGIQKLRLGLAMANSGTDVQLLNQARQFLAFMLYSQKQYRDAAVVGTFLCRNAPGQEAGLKGGLMALSSLQMLIAEVPKDENDRLIAELEKIGDFLGDTWPDNPEAAKAQGVRVRLLLQKDDYDGAKALIGEMKAGAEQAAFRRLLGQLLWNRSLELRNEDKDAQADDVIKQAEQILKAGLDGLPGNLVPGEALQAAVVLAKIQLKRDQPDKALASLDHPKYGPINLVDKQGPPTPSFKGDLYSTELKSLIGKMISIDNPNSLQARASKTMTKLRDAYPGADGQEKLTQTYMRLAKGVREQLDDATPAKKKKLIDVFNVLLNRLSDVAKDQATLRWISRTQIDLGEAAMGPNDVKATGQAKDLLTSAKKTLEPIRGTDPALNFLYGRVNLLVGNFKVALDEFEKILKANPMMLDAQIEAAQSYESWAAEVPQKISARVYEAALFGGRPDAKKKNVIWGWGKISQLTSSKPQYREKFLNARYHVALCRYLMGTKMGAAGKKHIEKAVTDITKLQAHFPDMGGKVWFAKFDVLLKQVQKAAGQPPTGLKPAPAPAAAKKAA